MTMQPELVRRIVRKWAVAVLALTVLGAVVAFAVSRAMTPLYQAKGNVLVVAGLGQSGGGTADLNLSAAEATTTAATLMTAPPLLQSVIHTQHLNEPLSTLAGNVAATPQTNSELVDVSVTDPSPTRAARIGNAIMSAFVAQITQQNTDRVNQAGAALQAEINQVQAALNQSEQQLATATAAEAATLRQEIGDQTSLLSQLTLNYGTFRATQQQNLETVTVATPASAPTTPSSPRTLFNTGVGALAGLLIGVTMAAILEFLDQGLKTAEDVRQRLGVPCIGLVPRHTTPGSGRERQERETLVASEAYRRLRTSLLFAAPDSQLRSVVITSARSGEGKTQTAANLSVALASADQRIVLVDADMRRPDMHRIFSRPLQGGMSELIMSVRPGENLSLRSARATSQPNLTLITAGTIPPNPSELLASRRAALLLHGLESAFDLVVIDTPPIDAVPDALNLAAEASATVVVVDAGRTNATQAQATIETLRSVGANVIGVVLNRAKEPRKPDYYYYYAEAPNEAGALNRTSGNASEPARLPAEYQRVAPPPSNGETRESSQPVRGAAG